MSQEFEFDCSAHPVTNGVNRKQKVYFSTPEEINFNTGMLLLIAGFGGNPTSKVYKKMRRVFADKYNLVVVQTEYLGTEFMGDITDVKFHYERFREFYNRFPLHYREDYITSDGQVKLSDILAAEIPTLEIPLLTITKETENNFVEMGPIQAIDCINALITVRSILLDNGYTINEDRTLAYGHSHGAYLALLANRLFPSLFSMIIDGAGWLVPLYLTKYRLANGKYKNHIIKKYTKYRITEHKFDIQIRDLRFLYKKFNNQANIITYQSLKDELVDSEEKSQLFTKVPLVKYNIVTSEMIDSQIFKSTAHGDFDFIKLFEHIIETYPDLTNKKNIESKKLKREQEIIETEFAKYIFFIEDHGPHMVINEKF